MNHDDVPPPPGAQPPLAEEAMRVAGALQDWVRQTFPAGGLDGHGGPECQWCPLCKVMAVLRGDRPEVTARVAEAGAAVAGAFRALLESTAQGAAAPASPDEPAQERPEPAPRVQHIDLGGTGR